MPLYVWIGLGIVFVAAGLFVFTVVATMALPDPWKDHGSE